MTLRRERSAIAQATFCQSTPRSGTVASEAKRRSSHWRASALHRLRCGGARHQGLHHPCFVAPVAAQVQQRRRRAAAQHQGLACIGLQPGLAHHQGWPAVRRSMPAAHRAGSARSPAGPLAHRSASPAMRRGSRTRGARGRQVGRALHMGQQGRGHQQCGWRLRVQFQHKRSQCAVEPPQPAGIAPLAQGGQGGIHAPSSAAPSSASSAASSARAAAHGARPAQAVDAAQEEIQRAAQVLGRLVGAPRRARSRRCSASR